MINYIPLLKPKTMATTSKNKSTPHQVFLHLLMIAMLYVSVISLITLLVQYINFAFPDELLSYSGSSDTIRYSSSTLIVGFPVFLLTSWLIAKNFKKNSDNRNSGIRKWLIYLTLFIAGVTIIVDLIQFVNSYYSGELTLPFFLKVIAVLLVTAWTFAYYLMDVLDKTYFRIHGKAVAVITSALVVIVIGAGFLIAGSPSHQREVRFDQQRSEDLQAINNQILDYWNNQKQLPEQLSELEQNNNYFTVPSDPQTDLPYEYTKTSPSNFTLCATFTTQSEEQPYADRYYQSAYYKHDTGNICFNSAFDAADLGKVDLTPLPTR